MLYLERKKEEIIDIGQDIKVKVIDISDNNVTLGFAAPKHVKIYRREINIKRNKNNQNIVHDFKDIKKLYKKH